MTPGLLAIGLTTLDINAYPVDALTHTERATLIKGLACAPAGTAAGAALVAAKLGMSVALAGAVGDDMNGLFVRAGLESLGIDTRLVAVRPGEATSSTLLAVESDGRRSSFHRPGAGMSPPIDPSVVAAAQASRFVHYAGVGGLTIDKGPGADLVAAAKAGGAVVTCDLIGPRPSAVDEIARILPHVDYFMPSAAEAVFLSGSDDLRRAARHFVDLGAKACLIKNGRRGVLALVDGEEHVVPAFAVDPVDTTSCGDSFCAGFIVALDRGWTPLDACRFAGMTAGLVAEGVGTLGALQDFDATVAAMDRYALAVEPV